MDSLEPSLNSPQQSARHVSNTGLERHNMRHRASWKVATSNEHLMLAMAQIKFLTLIENKVT